MRPQTPVLRKKIKRALGLGKKLKLLKNAYAGETCYLLTCGPSMKAFWSDEVREFLSDKLVMAVKQTYDLAPEIVDFHMLNSWNYNPYDYGAASPIIVSERASDDPPTPGMKADLLFHIPDPRNFQERLATSFEFDRWLFENSLDRPWGPGVMYEICFPLAVHLGVSEIITVGWDLGEKNSPKMDHFFPEAAEGSPQNDGIANKPRIRPFEVGDIAKSTRACYYWLRSKGIYLYVVSDRSLVDEVVPRVEILQPPKVKYQYHTELLANGNFYQWSDGRPTFWELASGRISGRKLTEDEAAVDLHPGGSDPVDLFQEVRLENFFTEARVSACFSALSHRPGALSLVISYHYPGKKKAPVTFEAHHPGDGEWHDVQLDTVVPPDTNRNCSVRISMRFEADEGSAASVKNVYAELEK